MDYCSSSGKVVSTFQERKQRRLLSSSNIYISCYLMIENLYIATVKLVILTGIFNIKLKQSRTSWFAN